MRKEHMAHLKFKLKMGILVISEVFSCKRCSLDLEVDIGARLSHLSVLFPILVQRL